MARTDWEPINPTELGGKIEQRYKNIANYDYHCVHCGSGFTITEDDIYGQPGNQVNSAMDGNGNPWLVALICSDCGYSIDSNDWADEILG